MNLVSLWLSGMRAWIPERQLQLSEGPEFDSQSPQSPRLGSRAANLLWAVVTWYGSGSVKAVENVEGRVSSDREVLSLRDLFAESFDVFSWREK